MCNAWNHSPGCDCGWGGGYSGGGGGIRTGLGGSLSDSIKISAPKAIEGYQSPIIADTREAQTYPTTCWWCGAKVFYHTNGYGDSVLFDSLGCPWQVHSCWKTYWDKEKIQRQQINRLYRVITNVNFWDLNEDQQKRLILAGAIQAVRSQKFFIKEEDVASYLGLQVKEFRKQYSLFYELYLEEKVIQVR
ncbi:hypothetical protein [Tolypothrix sp. VBCCA 56010]|uniref:hypothetical protein n=1 Tax=Tolypothrix sp. VBCCA 56010 TaxID=3137731 RepID=UPI003D7ED03E